MGLIHTDCTTHSFDAERWVVRTPAGRHLLLNRESHDLLQLLGGASDWGEAALRFNATYGEDLGEPEFRMLVAENFAGYRILAGEREEEEIPPRKSYLTARFPVVPPALAGRLAQVFVPLFAPRTFWWVFPAAFVIGAILLSLQYSQFFWQAPIRGAWATAGLIALGYLMHELGHIAGCRAAGSAHGAIGIGLYFFMPVCYADVSGIWTANRRQRAIANLGGIYLESLYCIVLIALHVVTGGYYFLGGATVLAVNLLFELNPFFRNDGYWILSDLTNTPNLVERSARRFRQIFARPRAGEPARDPAWLAAYAVANTVFVLGSLGLLIYHNFSPLLAFPALLLHTLGSWLVLDFGAPAPTYSWFLYLVIYYLCGKLVLTLLFTLLRSRPPGPPGPARS